MRYILLSVVCLSLFVIVRCTSSTKSYAALSPKTEFVGNETCKSCHKRYYDSYIETGMGHSFYLPTRANSIEDFSASSLVYDKFSDFYYHPFWKNDSLFLLEFRLVGKDTSYKRVEKINYVVGSGNQTRSYLLERKGYLYEVPITWYVRKKIWDLSPGYDGGHNSRFSREIGEECMACHTGNFEFVAGSKNRFKNIGLGIDCERCHGPASEHIKKMQAKAEIDVSKNIDYSIVNPKKLPIDAQFDVCQQCHLQGTNILQEGKKSVRDFRPSMALSDVYAVFVEKNENPDAFGIASHADRLKQSQCFIQSKGKLTCTTCHDPHKSIHKTDASIYIKQCEACHSPKPHAEAISKKFCTAPETEKMKVNGNCISCHLPKGGTSDIPHVSFHDHKIRVIKAESEQKSETNLSPSELQAEKKFVDLICQNSSSVSPDITAKAYLSYFETHNALAEYLEKAAKGLDEKSLYERARLAFYQKNPTQAHQYLAKALAKEPNNALLYFLQGEVYEAQSNFSAAQTAYETAFSHNPNSIEAELKATIMLLNAHTGDRSILPQAEQRLQKLLQQKPFDERLHSNLGFVLLNAGRFPEAERAFLKALQLNPDYKQALENLVAMYNAKGEVQKVKEYERRLNSPIK